MKLFLLLMITTLIASSNDDIEPKWQIGLSYAKFDYYEPGLMNEKGALPGLEIQYERKSRIYPITYNYHGELYLGGLHYDGATQGGTPVQTDTADSLINMRWTVFRQSEGTFVPYGGLAYRLWSNKIEGTGGYRRKITYLYLPLGVNINFGESFRFMLSLEYNLFILGRVTSHLEDVDPMLYPAENKQNSGGGFGATLTIQKGRLFGKIFYRRWDIDDSQPTSVYNLTVYEPENYTDMYGVTVGYRL